MACTPPGCRREPGEGARTPGVAPPVNLHCPFGASGQRHQGVPHFSASLSVTTLTLSLSLKAVACACRSTFFTLHSSPFSLCGLRETAVGHHLRCSQTTFVEQPDQALSRLARSREEDGLVVPIHCRPLVISIESVSYWLVNRN